MEATRGSERRGCGLRSDMKVLVLDIGGTHVKVYGNHHVEPVRFDSGPKMTPTEFIKGVRKVTDGWKYDAISIGYPGPVIDGKPIREPVNLGKGWVGFNFAKALGRPVRIINDAA